MVKRVLFSLMLLAGLSASAAAESLKMAVISDVHLMAPSLLKQDGEALEAYIANDRKLLREGLQLVREASARILDEAPDVLLITGDLTKDGETVSHLYLRDSCLAPLRDAGIRIFVIPGNHDVNNPHAVEFDGDHTTRVPTPSAEEFAQIYSDYGYGDAIARDSHSLSYVAQLAPGLRILCLDACRYEDNSFEENSCITPGRLKKETLRFIKEQAKAARKGGQRMIAMMHHGAVRHWKWQTIVMGDYLVDNWRSVGSLLGRLGVDVVFTGHFHSHDISTRGRLTDVETGSLVSYPAPMRFVKIDGDSMHIRTELLSGDGLSFPSGNSFEQEMLEYADGAMRGVVDGIIPEKVSRETKERCCAILAKAYTAHLLGDESVSEEDAAELKAAVKQLRRESCLYAFVLNRVGRNFWTDLTPADWDVTIELRPVK